MSKKNKLWREFQQEKEAAFDPNAARIEADRDLIEKIIEGKADINELDLTPAYDKEEENSTDVLAAFVNANSINEQIAAQNNSIPEPIIANEDFDDNQIDFSTPANQSFRDLVVAEGNSAPQFSMEDKLGPDEIACRSFYITPLATLRRAVVGDGIASFSFHLTSAMDIDVMPDVVKAASTTEISNLIELLKEYLILQSFPSAIYDYDEFMAKYKDAVSDYDEDKFKFYEETTEYGNHLIYCHVVDENAWNNLDEVISMGFVDGDDDANSLTYLEAYISMVFQMQVPHNNFYFYSEEEYIDAYIEDPDLNNIEEFEETFFNDSYTKKIQGNEEGFINIKKASEINISIITELNKYLEGDEEDDGESEEAGRETGELRREGREVVSGNVQEVGQVEEDRRETPEKKVAAPDTTTPEKGSKESVERDKESIQVDQAAIKQEVAQINDVVNEALSDILQSGNEDDEDEDYSDLMDIDEIGPSEDTSMVTPVHRKGNR